MNITQKLVYDIIKILNDSGKKLKTINQQTSSKCNNMSMILLNHLEDDMIYLDNKTEIDDMMEKIANG